MASNSNSNAMGRLFCAYNNVVNVKLPTVEDQEELQDLLDDARIILKDPGTYTAATIEPLCQQLESILEAYNAAIPGPMPGGSSMPPPPAPLRRKHAAQSEPGENGDAATSSLGVAGGKEVVPPMDDDEIDYFLASAAFKTLLLPCTTIIKAAEKGRWIELRCRTCGGNCTQAGHTPLRGLSSFSTHMQYFHGVPRASDAQTLKQCFFRNVEEHEVRAILAMGTAGAPFVQLVEVSKEKKQSSGGKVTTELVDVPKKGGGTKKAVVRHARDNDGDEYMGGVSSSTVPQASLTTADDEPRRRSSRIADRKEAIAQADGGQADTRPAKRQRKSWMSDETAEYEVDRLWYDVEERVYKTEQHVWLADLNSKAEDAGLLEGRAPIRT